MRCPVMKAGGYRAVPLLTRGATNRHGTTRGTKMRQGLHPMAAAPRRVLAGKAFRSVQMRRGGTGSDGSCVGRSVRLGLLKKRSHDRRAPTEFLRIYGVRGWRRRL